MPCFRLEKIDNQWCPGIIDLALKIEYRAFDFYRAMADRTEEDSAKTLFLPVAQAEKGHMRSLSRTYALCLQI
jgi:rubrerythrin